MTNQELWNRYCQYLRTYPKIGLSLDISRMRFKDDFLSSLQPRWHQALEAMRALEKGEIANPDEKRMVGHYWLRNPGLSPTAEIRSAIEESITSIKQFAADVHSGKVVGSQGDTFRQAIIVGIGGSALGPQLVYDALSNEAPPIELYFFDNTDPDGMLRVRREIGENLKSTLVIVISKSGGTIETRNGALEAAKLFSEAGLDFKKHVIAVTCPGSKLDGQATEEGWLRRFHMWDWVGGRTSLFSAVGLLPAALQGADIGAFIAGAAEMDQETRGADLMQNPAALLSAMWLYAGEVTGKRDMVVLPYKDRLVLVSKYLQQLVMESLGKERDLKGKVVHQGIAVYGNKGSTDQHAYVQQLRDGLNNFFATFIEVLDDYSSEADSSRRFEVEPGITSGDYLSGFLQGTRRALFENDRDSVTLTLNTVSPFSLGAVIALFERAVGFYASLVGVNAYHQPGVEAGKKAAATVIDVQKKVVEHLRKTKQSAGAEALAAELGLGQEIETIYKVLEHLAANGSSGVKKSGGPNPKNCSYTLG